MQRVSVGKLFMSRPCLRPDGSSLAGMPARGSLIFPDVEWLGIQENPYGGGWAAGRSYGYKLRSLLAGLKGEEYAWPESTETVER